MATDKAVAATLSANARANGGHFARCASTLVGCIGRTGEDTAAHAAANSAWTLTIAFLERARPIHYTLTVTTSVQAAGTDFSLSVRDRDGTQIPLSGGSSGTAQIAGGPGKTFQVSASLASNVSDRGGCCSQTKTGSASIGVSLSRSPILETESDRGSVALIENGEEIRIVGGKPENGYPAVGALLLDGKMQCSGTLVGTKTVLTAAHCLYGLEPVRLTFVQGAVIFKPTSVYKVIDKALPTDPGGPFRYDDITLQDDIGLVYLAEPSTTDSAKLHANVPKLADLLNQQLPLTFVGFGYDVVEGEHTGLGVKRLVTMPLQAVGERRFRYGERGKNTCNGDSGGPAFVDDGKHLYLAGVTSSGDGACSDHGTDTRVDYYLPWLSKRIR